LGLRYNVRFLAALMLGGMATLAIAQEHAGQIVAAAGVEQAFTRLPDEARLDSLPAELKTESAIYLQRRLGTWRERDAREILGEPRRRRDAYEQGVVTGDIFAFGDPTNRYREFELLFDRQTKTLRSAFIYPWRMTWNECRELWGNEVNATVLANGNIFRSYLNRRLDVLVDKTGTVINLGIY
jgi:hypothetical protein